MFVPLMLQAWVKTDAGGSNVLIVPPARRRLGTTELLS
jgi:hypothetical protein